MHFEKAAAQSSKKVASHALLRTGDCAYYIAAVRADSGVLKRCYDCLDFLGKLLGLLHGLSLTVDANDRFGIRLAQMHP